MNNAEKYIYEVYSKKSFTDAAKKLFVSQPSLSATIKKHEAKLGYDIFDRTTNPVSLTKEGTAYIDYLEESMELENQLKQRLQSLNRNSSKVLCIGGSNSASHIAIPKICALFSRKFPDVIVNIDVGEFGQNTSLMDKLDKGNLDIVITSNVDSQKYKATTLWREKYLMVIRKSYPGINKLSDYCLSYDEVLSGVIPAGKIITDWDFFKNINVFKPGKSRKAWKIFCEFFAKASYEMVTVNNFKNLDMHYELMKEGLGAAVLPQSSIIKNGYNPEELCCFAIDGEDNVREVMMVYKDDSQLTKYAKEFIQIGKDCFN